MKELTIIIGIFCAACVGFYAIEQTTKSPSDYQLEIKANKVKVWDGSRLVGECQLNKIDSLIINDNQ